MSVPGVSQRSDLWVLAKGLGMVGLDVLTLHGTLFGACLFVFAPGPGAGVLAVSLVGWALVLAWEKRR